jgi:hypothetical protein
VLNNLAVIVDAKISMPAQVWSPGLTAMQNDIVAFGNHAFELDTLTGVVAGGLLKIVNEAFTSRLKHPDCAVCNWLRRSAQ